jgi:hypothetical protein
MHIRDRLFQAAYPGSGDAVTKGVLSCSDARELSRQFVTENIPEAEAAFGFAPPSVGRLDLTQISIWS